jgi:prefoldin subunit 5
MRKTIALWSILALCMTMTAIVPSASAATDRVWLTTGVDTNVSAGTMITGYVRAAPGEVVTVNWKAGIMGSSYQLSIWFYPSVPAMNWSQFGGEAYNPMSFRYWSVFAGSPPGAAWIRSGGFDVIYIQVSNSGSGAPTVTFNVTVTRDNWTTVLDPNGLDAKLAELNSTVSALQNYTASLNDTLGEMGNSMLDNFTSLGDQLDVLNASLAQTEVLLRALMDMNDTALRNALDADNASLHDNLQNLSEQLAALRSEVQNISFPVAGQYNDTLLWKEISGINANYSKLLVRFEAGINVTWDSNALHDYIEHQLHENITALKDQVSAANANATSMRQTLSRLEAAPPAVNRTTYVNRTEVLSAGNNEVVAGAVAGVATGAIVSGAGVALIDRRMRKRMPFAFLSPRL